MRTRCPRGGFIPLVLLSAGIAFGADPRLMNLVMPDASAISGVNVANAKNSPFGQYVLSQMTSAINGQLQPLVTATGFDPRQDVSEILAASPGGNPANPAVLVLALGNFPVSQITAAIAASAPQITVQNYGGATLITGGSAKTSFSAAFFGTTIAALGDSASVKAAVDRSTAVNSIDPALAAQVQNLSTTEDAWAITIKPVSSLVPGTNAPGGVASPVSQIAQMLSAIQASSGGVKFGASVDMTGQAIAADANSATSLAAVAQALVSIVAMGAAQNPQAASVAPLLQSLQVTASGTAINLALSIPETQLETLLNGIKAAGNPAAKPAKRAAKPVIAPKASLTPKADASAIAVAAKSN